MLIPLIMFSMELMWGGPLQLLGSTWADYLKCASFLEKGASEKECVSAVRFSEYCVNCVTTF